MRWLAAAVALGFSQPVAISPADGTEASSVSGSMAPDGRVAVVWRRTEVGGRYRGRLYANIDGPPQPIAKSAWGSRPLVVSTPDGAFVACWADEHESTTHAIRCATAPPGAGAFGTPRRIAVLRRGQPRLAGMAVDGAGRVVVLWTRDAARLRNGLYWAASAGARWTRPARLGTVGFDTAIWLANGPRGEVVVAWPRSSVAVLAPGAKRFATARVDLGRAEAIRGPRLVQGGSIRVAFTVLGPRGFREVLSSRRRDGTFSRPVPLGVDEPAYAASLLAPGDGGGLLALVHTVDVINACDEPVVSRLSTMRAGRTVPLSDPRQLVASSDIDGLDDGTVIAVWSDGFGSFPAQSRVEYAIRPPGGSFGPATPLPLDAAEPPELIAGKRGAAIVWPVGTPDDGPSHLVMTTLRTEPPFAEPAQRPSNPSLGC